MRLIGGVNVCYKEVECSINVYERRTNKKKIVVTMKKEIKSRYYIRSATQHCCTEKCIHLQNCHLALLKNTKKNIPTNQSTNKKRGSRSRKSLPLPRSNQRCNNNHYHYREEGEREERASREIVFSSIHHSTEQNKR